MVMQIVSTAKKAKQAKKLERQLVVIQKKAAKIVKIDKTNRKKLPLLAKKKAKSTFEDKTALIHKRLTAGKVDSAIELIQKQMLRMLIDTMPIAEKGYRKYKNERAAYALNAMVSGAREVISDIQATKDQSQLIEKILVGIMQPAFISIAQQVVASTQHSYKEIEDYIDVKRRDAVKKTLTDSAKAVGSYLNDQLGAIRTRMEKEIG